MATLGSTQVTAGALGFPVPIGGLHLECWRVAGGSVADTATITPAHGRFLVTAVGGDASTTISNPQTNVVFTLTASAATDTTFDVWLLLAE